MSAMRPAGWSDLPISRLTRAIGILVVLLTVLWLGLPPSAASAERTPGLVEARAKANEITAELNALQSELANIDGEVLRLDEEHRATSTQLNELRNRVRELAVERYVGLGNEVVFIPGADINLQGRADAMVGIVTQTDSDAVDEFRAAKDRLERTSKELADKKATQAARLGELEDRREALYEELTRLEVLEAERVEAERKAAEEAARRAADEKAKQEAQAQADQLAARQQAVDAGRKSTPSTTVGSTQGNGGATGQPTAPASPAQPIASGAFVCPVQGAVSFVNSWGFARASGNRHQGVDMMSPRGTPVVIPVSGTVKTRTGGIGGLQFHLNGDDGNFYYGAHMDSFSGAQGHLPAGTVVGYVGDTGDARGTGTHLHFEIHPGGWPNAVNPYETVSKYC